MNQNISFRSPIGWKTMLVLAGLAVPQAARADCSNILECAPDVTFVCKSGSDIDLRIYVSSKLKSVFYRQRKIAGVEGVEDIRLTYVNFTAGPGGYARGISKMYNLPNTAAIQKFYRFTFLDLDSNNIRLARYAVDPQLVDCRRVPGRHLDDAQ